MLAPFESRYDEYYQMTTRSTLGTAIVPNSASGAARNSCTHLHSVYLHIHISKSCRVHCAVYVTDGIALVASVMSRSFEWSARFCRYSVMQYVLYRLGCITTVAAII